MFHITHREEQVSDPTERRRQFRSHSGKNNCTKQTLLGWFSDLCTKIFNTTQYPFGIQGGRYIFWLSLTWDDCTYLYPI